MPNFISILILSVFFAGAASGADKYEIDRTRSTVGFAVRNLVINKVGGNFKDYSGTFIYDEGDITKSSVNVTVKADSIFTNHKKRDSLLKGPEFFDAVKYPEITFQSKRFVKNGDETNIVGILTMHGVSKEIVIPVNITDIDGSRLGIQAVFKLNRHDYGLYFKKSIEFSGLVVWDEVEIKISIEAVKI